MLSPYRVLDLTDEWGLLCGQILADLGADVIAVEPPGGSPARRLGPFAGGEADRERSLHWWAYARNKRSIALDLQTEAGRSELRDLARGADFLIESAPPGELGALGLGHADLETVNPALVYVSITPYGQGGPKASWAATDLTVWAAGGPLVITGDEDRPPVRVSVPQSGLHAGAEAALAALVAHFARLRTGRGQHVDVSAQQAVTFATQAGILAAAVNTEPFERIAGGTRMGDIRLQLTYPAKDGHVSITHFFGSTIGPMTRRLMEFVHESGFCDRKTLDKDWEAYGELLLTGQEPIEEFERVKQTVAACTRSKTKAELLQAALDRSLLLAPITTIKDVLESEQLASRGYPQTLETPDGRRATWPGPFARFPAKPIRYRLGPPRLDEHAAEIRAEVRNAPAAGRDPSIAAGEPGEDRPLAGVKILDFMWALAGPGATRTLADCGATVIRIESTSRLDVCRTLSPWLNGEVGPENSAIFHSTNAGKRMFTLDPNTPEGHEVVLDLVRWADVVTESFSPRGMKGFGLDYETLRGVNPDLIMLSTCLMGQTGPLARFAGFGNLAAAISGFHELTGWPDRDPAGPFSAYTDYIAPRYNAIAVLAALEHRRRTREGQYIDLSQTESALHFLAPAMLEYSVNGNIPSRVGNQDTEMAPHGVYACAGEDCWVAVACRDDADWRALCALVGERALADDARFASGASRLEHTTEVDAVVASFTEKLPMHEAERQLQEAGVPAGAVQNSPELCEDEQLALRGHFVELPHPTQGKTVVEGTRFILSRSPVGPRGAAPTFGADNDWVLGEVLGYDDDKIAEIVIAGALE